MYLIASAKKCGNFFTKASIGVVWRWRQSIFGVSWNFCGAICENQTFFTSNEITNFTLDVDWMRFWAEQAIGAGDRSWLEAAMLQGAIKVFIKISSKEAALVFVCPRSLPENANERSLLSIYWINSRAIPGQTDEANVYNTTSCLPKPYRCPHPFIRFFLYTRRTQELGEEIDVLNQDSLWNSHWNPMHPVKVIIHGERETFAFC